MHNKPFKILFTRSIPEDLINYGKECHLNITAEEFIQIQHREMGPELLELLQNEEYPNWIFTSQNAAKVLHPWLQKLNPQSQRNCFAVGQKTAQKVAELGFMSMVPEQQNAENLVKLLESERPTGGFLYFCGNIRRNTLVDYFAEKDIPYREVVVYDTQLIQPEIRIEEFDAVCFCSPSAVDSFFSRYQLHPEIPCFAIGETTACSLVEHSDHVIVSETPTLHGVIDTCNEYLKS